MIDYLERLLERLREEENETRDVPRLEEAVPAPNSPPDRGQDGSRSAPQASQAPQATQAALATQERAGFRETALERGAAEAAFPASGVTTPVGGPGPLSPEAPGGGPETVTGPLSAHAALGDALGVWPAAPGEIAGGRPAVSREIAGGRSATPRETAGDSLERALGRAVDALDRAENGPGRTSELPELSAQWPAVSSSGAAGLARRLAQAALATPPEAARTLFAVEEKSAPSAGWEEFDRRLERDARRYDGGIELY